MFRFVFKSIKTENMRLSGLSAYFQKCFQTSSSEPTKKVPRSTKSFGKLENASYCDFLFIQNVFQILLTETCENIRLFEKKRVQHIRKKSDTGEANLSNIFFVVNCQYLQGMVTHSACRPHFIGLAFCSGPCSIKREVSVSANQIDSGQLALWRRMT